MSNLSYVDLLRTSALVTFLLLLKFVAVTARWAVAKTRAGLRAPEDSQNPNPPTPEQLTTAERARLVVFNDLENLPLGLIVIWAAALCIGFSMVPGNAKGSPVDQETLDVVRAHVGLTIIFCAARYLHTAVYSFGGFAPLRSAVFTIGLASILALNIVGIVSIFRSQFDSNWN